MNAHLRSRTLHIPAEGQYESARRDAAGARVVACQSVAVPAMCVLKGTQGEWILQVRLSTEVKRRGQMFDVAVSAEPKHPVHLGDDAARIGDCAQDKARDHGVHTRVRKVDLLPDHIAYLEFDLMPFGGQSKGPVHVRVRLDCDDLRSRPHVAEVGPDASPDLDHVLGRSAYTAALCLLRCQSM